MAVLRDVPEHNAAQGLGHGQGAERESGMGWADKPPGWRATQGGFSIERWKLISFTQFTDFLFITVFTFVAVLHFQPAFGQALFAHVLAIVILAALLKHSFFSAGLYEPSALLHAGRAIAPLMLRWTVAAAAIGLIVALFQPLHHGGVPWLLRFYVMGLAGFAAQRLLVSAIFKGGVARGGSAKTVAILGANPLSEQLVTQLKDNEHGVRFVGVFDDRNRDAAPDVAGVPKRGGLEDLIDYARDERVDMVVVTLPTTATDRLAFVRERFRQLPLNVRILAGPMALEEGPGRGAARGGTRGEPSELPGVQLLTMQNRPISEPALLAKGLFDKLAAGVALLLISPLLLACAVGIAISSPGPIFFRQKRIGFKGKMFDIIKFRTMHATARQNTQLTQKNDPRIFPFGQLLRKLSIDELPQLFNVLRGDMSLIGPRPHMPEARAAGELYFEAVREYADRHRVMPGITGWAQVNGWRGPTETLDQLARRVEFDLYYIENWSLALDAIIFVKTISVGFFGKNAF